MSNHVQNPPSATVYGVVPLVYLLGAVLNEMTRRAPVCG
jgi:hypothetical protein